MTQVSQGEPVYKVVIREITCIALKYIDLAQTGERLFKLLR